jgi:hypothetical protein
MNSNEIDIASYLTRIESSGDPVNNILAVSLDLAEELKIVVGKEERLKIKNNEIPILEVSPILKKGCTEILMWAIGILASAWAMWCFTSKSNNPTYQNDPKHSEASENVRIAMPYIRSSIIDAMSKAKDIGTKETGDPKTAYRPESGAAFIRLSKE